MSSSHCNLLYHIVFSTKDREPWMSPSIRPRIHEYLGGAIRGERGIALIANDTGDHVHILAKLRQDKAISKVIGEVKATPPVGFRARSKWQPASRGRKVTARSL
jgi:REP element-mobilizing transposase RayT